MSYLTQDEGRDRLGNLELTRLISKQNCEKVSFRKSAPLNLRYRGYHWKEKLTKTHC